MDRTDPASVARHIKQFYDRRELKSHLEIVASRNAAYLENKQWSGWSEELKRMMPMLTRLGRMRDDDTPAARLLKYNVLRALVYQKSAKLGRVEAVWSVIGFNSDEWDQVVARFSNDLMHHYYLRELHVPDLFDKSLLHFYCSPATWIEWGWDATKGESRPVTLDDFYRDVPPNMAPQQADMMRQQDLQQFQGLHGYRGDNQPVQQNLGDLSLRIQPIHNVIWDPFYVQTWEQVHAYLVAEVWSPGEVVRRCGVTLEEALRHVGGEDYMDYQQRIISGWQSSDHSIHTLGIINGGGILVRRMYVDKIAAPPYGFQALLIGGEMNARMMGPLNNAMQELPLVGFSEYDSTQYAWGDGSMSDVISAQHDINLARTQMKNWRDKRVKAKIIRDTEDEGDTNALSGDQLVYECDIEKKPEVLQFNDLGAEERESVEFNLRFIHDAMGIPEIDLGRSDEIGKSASGKKVVALQDQAAERLRGLGKKLNAFWGKIGQACLAELQQKATEERLTEIVGENNIGELKVWSAANLRPSHYDPQRPWACANVSVTAFTNIPVSVPEMRNIILTLAEMGVLDPKENRRLIAQAFGLNDFRSILDAGRRGRAKQEREIRQWVIGKSVPPPGRNDDHESEADVIVEWMTTDEYIMLAAENPAIGFEINEHLEAHEQGKYDRMAEEQFRAEWAMYRAAGYFKARGDMAGQPDLAQFAMQKAMLSLTGGAVPPEAKPPRGGNEGGNSNSNGNGTGRPAPDRKSQSSPQKGQSNERAYASTPSS